MLTLLRRQTTLPALALLAFNSVLFAPIMGRGFLFDDFGHIYVAAHESLRFGLTQASGGWFYAPMAYLSFKLDWLLWGLRPYPWAGTNLLIHSLNTLLLYGLVLRLWGSRSGAWWAALGFALLFRANVGAIMNIAARAHLIVALFYLATLHAALWFVRAKSKAAGLLAVVVFATAAMFSKESGLTIVAAIGCVIAYEVVARGGKVSGRALISLSAALAIVLLIYVGLRLRSGSVPISFSGPPCCSYVLSFKLLAENILFYARWTYGLLAPLAVAVILSLTWRGARPRFDFFTRHELWLSILLFATATAPFILMNWHTEAYGYLPGISAALLLGAVTSSLYRPFSELKPLSALNILPILCIGGVYVALTVIASGKWMRAAQTNAIILRDILTQQPTVGRNTVVSLTYAKADPVGRFPEGFGSYSFPWAIRVLYGDPTLDGRIRLLKEPSGDCKAQEVCFAYVGGEAPRVFKHVIPHSH